MRLGARTAALVPVVALAAAGCALLGGGADAGDTVAAEVQALGTDAAVVQLPTGRLSVLLGEPVDSVAADEAADQEDHDPPDGGAFVGVGWTFDPGAGLSTTQKAMVLDDDVTPTVTLVAGGDRYPIDQALDDDPALFVAVAGSDDVRLEVDFDGVVQTVSSGGRVDEGDAAALYDATGSRAPLIDCSDQRLRPPADLDLLCSAELDLVPYVSGPGWADAGAAWAVVRLETTVSGVEVTSTEDSSTLDGDDPTLTVPSDVTRPGFRSDQLVFDSSADAAHVLDVARTYTTADGTTDGTTQVTLRP
ncbi:hypothetical protein [Nocardioides mangrovi]|uniref:Uncharacterized protein n=1 Tax=Nocardioides mangrovi TaxID=2874580 RepID=A0ABS7UA02_9ACTN|nr:hypothetical protein [Nocardioides mangrovi]MBZ5737487.1 hypothetical protein [Nocardioides mangrovi]